MTTKAQCEAHKVTQCRCRRVAAVTRRTSGGATVKLCAKCDARFGESVGSKASN